MKLNSSKMPLDAKRARTRLKYCKSQDTQRKKQTMYNQFYVNCTKVFLFGYAENNLQVNALYLSVTMLKALKSLQ